jgi:hypothetical protein
MAVSYLQRRGLATNPPERVLSLTAGGLDELDDYRDRCSAADSVGLRAALNDVLTQTPALSAGLTPPPGCWRAQNPYLTQTRRLMADPVLALPWHPMVLHRGGWPDGS